MTLVFSHTYCQGSFFTCARVFVGILCINYCSFLSSSSCILGENVISQLSFFSNLFVDVGS